MPEKDDIAKRLAARTAALTDEKKRDEEQRTQAADAVRKQEEALLQQAQREFGPSIAAITAQMNDPELEYLLQALLNRIDDDQTHGERRPSAPTMRYPSIELDRGVYRLQPGTIELVHGIAHVHKLSIDFAATGNIHLRWNTCTVSPCYTLLELKNKLIDAIATFDVHGVVYLATVFNLEDDPNVYWFGM